MLAVFKKVKRKASRVKNKIVMLNAIRVIKRSKNLYGRTKLKLNLGSCAETQAGFINIDINPLSLYYSSLGSAAECLVRDLSKGIPADNESTSYIYSSHFFEHVEYFDLINLLSDCLRVLEKGGVLRIAKYSFCLSKT